MSELEFSNLNAFGGLEFLSANSPEALKAQITQIRSPIKIVSMYSSGTNHYVWFLSDVKIKKQTKENKNGNGR